MTMMIDEIEDDIDGDIDDDNAGTDSQTWISGKCSGLR